MILYIYFQFHIDLFTVKPVYKLKGQPWERQHMVFIDKLSLFGGYIVLFNQGRVTEV